LAPDLKGNQRENAGDARVTVSDRVTLDYREHLLLRVGGCRQRGLVPGLQVLQIVHSPEWCSSGGESIQWEVVKQLFDFRREEFFELQSGHSDNKGHRLRMHGI